MTVAWTEMGSLASHSFTPSGSGWQNYDIYTNLSVPKGAVAYICCDNGNDAANATVGVRTDGSSLSRYVMLHEAEAGGANSYGTWVTVDASTGYIETYCNSTTGVTFHCMGYLTGTVFTEAATLFSVTSGDATTSFSSGGGKNWTLSPASARVHHIVCGTPAEAAATYLGVRIEGSSLIRRHSVHEAEADTSEGQLNCISMAVKTDGSGIVEVCHTSGTSEKYYDMGYFDTAMDYTELAPTAASITSNATWTDFDATSYIDADGRLLDCYCMTNISNAESYIGVRTNGSSITDRYILIAESETNVNNGYAMPAKSDSGGIVEFYIGNAATEYTGIQGYFIFTEATPTGFAHSFGVVIA